MSLTPAWPDAPGPRVLMLVANDMTIDTRVRKTASSIARAGFSVISLGVDVKETAPADEAVDGALLTRVVPLSDPRVSPRRIRLSRRELLEAIVYRAEVRKRLLHIARRALSAEVAWNADNPPRWTASVGRATASVARAMGISDDLAGRAAGRLTRYARRVWKGVRFGPAKIRALYHQALHQLALNAARLLARPSRPLLRRASWRRDLPELHRFEAALGPIIDNLEPELIHVHDVFLLGVAARATSRARTAGKSTVLLYDAHEYVQGLAIDIRRREALYDLEQEFFGRVDAVVTVSDGLADLLEARYGKRPSVVMNAPDTTTNVGADSIRRVVGVDETSPLVVYVGGVAPHRGAEVLIEAMTTMGDDVHLVFVSNSTTGYVLDLLRAADRAGLGERVHLAPYVAPEAVVAYISSATVSAVPLSRDFMNYEVALPNKLFQSIHAGVPVAVSNNPEMERFVKAYGVGEVFAGGDPISLGNALRNIIESPQRYTEALRDPQLLSHISWGSQMQNLLETYRQVGVALHD